MLLNAFGGNVVSTVQDELRLGRYLIVVDALDEAALKVGPRSFEAFLSNLCENNLGDRERPVIVLLGRVETCELVEVALEEHNIHYAKYQVDSFAPRDAKDFVDKWLDERKDLAGKARTHQTQRLPFERAREQMFSFVVRALNAENEPNPWATRRVRDFLGYAPVLESIAQYLDVDSNYERVANQLEQVIQARRRKDAWSVLEDIMSSLADREKRRVLSRIRPALQHLAGGWSDWDSLYQPDEQYGRVLARALEEPQAASTPTSVSSTMPRRLREEYDEVVSGQVREHPFLGNYQGFANVVFQEYVYAWALTEPNVYGGLRQMLRQIIRAGSYLPSPLVGQFMLAPSNSHEEAQVSAADVGLVYESVLAQERRAGEVYFAISSLPDGMGTGLVAMRKDSPQIDFSILDMSEGIVFWRRLAHADIHSSGPIILGRSEAPFSLGPSVLVQSGILGIRASQLYVAPGNGGTVLIAERFDELIPGMQLRVFPGGPFQVRWPELRYPWIDYRLEEDTSAERFPAVAEAFRELRRILRAFRGAAYFPDLVRGRLYIDNIIVHTELGKDLVQFLLNEGVLQIRDGRVYILDRGRTAQIGVNWNDVQLLRLSDETMVFLEAFIMSRERKS
jgi:hypothetical protein